MGPRRRTRRRRRRRRTSPRSPKSPRRRRSPTKRRSELHALVPVRRKGRGNVDSASCGVLDSTSYLANRQFVTVDMFPIRASERGSVCHFLFSGALIRAPALLYVHPRNGGFCVVTICTICVVSGVKGFMTYFYGT